MLTKEAKPYEPQEGEPNIWYDRFVKFMLLGSGRSLARCYRDVINTERSTKGRPSLPTTARCPQSWRQRARQFDWWHRAEAWDREQRRLTLQKVDQTRRLAQDQAREALQIHLDLMRGELKGPDGQLTEGQNSAQRRMAADSVLDRAGVLPEDPNLNEERQEVKIREIRVNLPGSQDESAG